MYQNVLFPGPVVRPIDNIGNKSFVWIKMNKDDKDEYLRNCRPGDLIFTMKYDTATEEGQREMLPFVEFNNKMTKKIKKLRKMMMDSFQSMLVESDEFVYDQATHDRLIASEKTVILPQFVIDLYKIKHKDDEEWNDKWDEYLLECTQYNELFSLKSMRMNVDFMGVVKKHTDSSKYMKAVILTGFSNIKNILQGNNLSGATAVYYFKYINDIPTLTIHTNFDNFKKTTKLDFYDPISGSDSTIEVEIYPQSIFKVLSGVQDGTKRGWKRKRSSNMYKLTIDQPFTEYENEREKYEKSGAISVFLNSNVVE